METCQRCGWRCTTLCPAYCPACGAQLAITDDSSRDTTNSYRRPFAMPIKNLTVLQLPDLSGSRKISGTVTAIGLPYMGKEEFVWHKCITKILVGIIVVPIVAFVLGILVITMNAVSWMPSVCKDDGKGKKGFFVKIIKEIAGYVFNRRHFVLHDEMPVRDVRLRSTDGRENLATIPGELRVCSFDIGDAVDIEGVNRNGLLMVTGGYNHTRGTQIRIHRS